MSGLEDLRTLAKAIGLTVSKQTSYEAGDYVISRDDEELFQANSEDHARAFLLGWIACQGQR